MSEELSPEEIARKIFSYRLITDWGNEDPSGNKREMFIGNLIEDIAEAISDERKKSAELQKQLEESKLNTKHFEESRELLLDAVVDLQSAKEELENQLSEANKQLSEKYVLGSVVQEGKGKYTVKWNTDNYISAIKELVEGLRHVLGADKFNNSPNINLIRELIVKYGD